MGSILSVEQLRGLSSGDTPNTITLPAGQTFDATAGTTEISVLNFSAKMSGSQSVTNDAYTRVAYDTIIFDPNNIWDTSNSWWLVTANQVGIWQLNATAKSGNGLGIRNILRVRDITADDIITYAETPMPSASDAVRGDVTFNQLIEVTAGQKIVIEFYHNYGSDRTVSGSATDIRTAISAFKIAGPSS
jgi:hypothetical protein